MATEHRAALIIKQCNELAQTPLNEEATQRKASLEHLIWLSLETKDDIALSLIERSLSGSAKQMFFQVLNEVALQTPVKKGQRVLYPQLIAIPLVIERDCFGSQLPDTLIEHVAIRTAIHNAFPDRAARGLSVHQKLYSYGELSRVSRSELYRMTIETVKSAWNNAAIAPLELQGDPHDKYTVDVSETADSVVALRFILATTFSYTKADCYMDESSLKSLGQQLAFYFDDNLASTTNVSAIFPQRLDRALTSALPTLYSKITRTLMCDSSPLEIEVQMSMPDDEAILKMTWEDGSCKGFPLSFPLGQDSMAGQILSSLQETVSKFSDATFTITYGSSESPVLH